MDFSDPISPDEILIRRVPPNRENSESFRRDENGIERPTSGCMQPRKNKITQEVEVSLSCSRLKYTSPLQLLDQLRHQDTPIDPKGWGVCVFRASDVTAIEDGSDGRLSVRHEPTSFDLGHSGIYGNNGQPCPRTKGAAQRLSRIARMLSEGEVTRLQAGDNVDLSCGSITASEDDESPMSS